MHIYQNWNLHLEISISKLAPTKITGRLAFPEIFGDFRQNFSTELKIHSYHFLWQFSENEITIGIFVFGFGFSNISNKDGYHFDQSSIRESRNLTVNCSARQSETAKVNINTIMVPFQIWKSENCSSNSRSIFSRWLSDFSPFQHAWIKFSFVPNCNPWQISTILYANHGFDKKSVRSRLENLENRLTDNRNSFKNEFKQRLFEHCFKTFRWWFSDLKLQLLSVKIFFFLN